jgi:threonine aldolase
MRRAMAGAPVGDDVYGEDPTVNELEALAARKTGFDAALFVSSGTMGNITAILSHTNRGDEAILGSDSHVMNAESGGLSSLGGIMPKPVPTDLFGMMAPEDIINAVSPDDQHFARTRLILVENTYGRKNGFPLEPSYFAQIQEIAKGHDLLIHMDGARLFNAAIALGVDVRRITQHVDSVTFCLSKGLCAPVGSLLCGSEDFIYRARRVRKMLGGGMRQAGILAAAGIVALEEMIDRLAVDHQNAQMLAKGLAEIPGIEVDLDLIKTNLVFFSFNEEIGIDAYHVANSLRERANTWLDVVNKSRIRAVTHYWVGETEVNRLLKDLRDNLHS